jgi:phosphate transport system ATP-binding protein
MKKINWQTLPISVTTRSEIVTENLTLSYGKKIALRSINLTLRSGSISAIIGPSGCGKSSLLNCLNRVIELTPNCQVSGKVLLDNCDIQTLNPIDLRRRVGMLFQKPTPFPLSILRNIEFPLREHGIRDRHQLDEIIETTLQNVGLWNEVKDRLKSPALSLSGGQQQRLCLARALALNPDVLLMDEPCSALDPMSSEIVENTIEQLRGKYTVVVVTHNLSQARRIADEVALFWLQDGAGTLIEMGSVDQMFNSPQHPLTQAYISGRKG